MNECARRRWGLGFIVVICVAALAASSQAAILVATADLDGSQENPPVNTAAVGGMVLAVDTVADTYDATLFVSGIAQDRLTASPAHIHIGAVGFNGGITHNFLNDGGTITAWGTDGFRLDVVGGPFNGSTVVDHPSTGAATLLQHLQNGDLYVNVHTTQHTGGEIRGQLSVVPEPASVGLLALAGVALLRRRQ